MTRDKAVKFVTVLAAYFPGTELSEATLEAYSLAVSGLEEAKALKVLPRIVAECKYFPSVHEILRIAAEVDGPPSAEEAWAEVMQKVRSVGSYGRPRFSHDLIREAVQAVGWMNICLSENPGVERSHFFRVYESLQNRELQRSMADVAASGLTQALVFAWNTKLLKKGQSE